MKPAPELRRDSCRPRQGDRYRHCPSPARNKVLHRRADDGWSEEWPVVGIDLGAAQLRRRADEQSGDAMPAAAFRAWTERHASPSTEPPKPSASPRRTVACCLSGEQPVPKAVMLATEGYDKRRAA